MSPGERHHAHDGAKEVARHLRRGHLAATLRWGHLHVRVHLQRHPGLLRRAVELAAAARRHPQLPGHPPVPGPGEEERQLGPQRGLLPRRLRRRSERPTQAQRRPR